MTNTIVRGDLSPQKKVLIMIHGRGASAEDILSLSNHLSVADYTLIAPQAPGHTWYPFSFISPQSQNEPHLSNSLSVISEIVNSANSKGISDSDIYFLGFSQGACLTLEYVTRNAKKWGGVIAFTGGLIGDTLSLKNYKGNFEGTRFYIGSSNPDPHVPVARVRESEKVLQSMNAKVKMEIFDNMGHTINEEEIENANKILSNSI